MLKRAFDNLLAPYTSDLRKVEELWSEIDHAHSAKGRYYHNLMHLKHLFDQLSGLQNQLNDWQTVQFSIFYHDMVYNTRKNDNEERSALLAEKRMLQLGVEPARIEQCKHQIRCTQSHHPSDSDTNFFTDTDLGILGTSLSGYQNYAAQIRKEYSIYPDFLYKPGRKKVLAHFLNMDRIYKTDYFYQKLEPQCRLNLQWELDSLS